MGKRHGVRLELTSLDLEDSWGEYVRLMGFRFCQWDLRTGQLLSRLGYQPGDLHFVIVSAVMEMYMANDNCCDWLAKLLLQEGVGAALIDSRECQNTHLACLFALHAPCASMQQEYSHLPHRSTHGNARGLLLPPPESGYAAAAARTRSRELSMPSPGPRPRLPRRQRACGSACPLPVAAAVRKSPRADLGQLTSQVRASSRQFQPPGSWAPWRPSQRTEPTMMDRRHVSNSNISQIRPVVGQAVLSKP